LLYMIIVISLFPFKNIR